MALTEVHAVAIEAQAAVQSAAEVLGRLSTALGPSNQLMSAWFQERDVLYARQRQLEQQLATSQQQLATSFQHNGSVTKQQARIEELEADVRNLQAALNLVRQDRETEQQQLDLQRGQLEQQRRKLKQQRLQIEQQWQQLQDKQRDPDPDLTAPAQDKHTQRRPQGPFPYAQLTHGDGADGQGQHPAPGYPDSDSDTSLPASQPQVRVDRVPETLVAWVDDPFLLGGDNGSGGRGDGTDLSGRLGPGEHAAAPPLPGAADGERRGWEPDPFVDGCRLAGAAGPDLGQDGARAVAALPLASGQWGVGAAAGALPLEHRDQAEALQQQQHRQQQEQQLGAATHDDVLAAEQAAWASREQQLTQDFAAQLQAVWAENQALQEDLRSALSYRRTAQEVRATNQALQHQIQDLQQRKRELQDQLLEARPAAGAAAVVATPDSRRGIATEPAAVRPICVSVATSPQPPHPDAAAPPQRGLSHQEGTAAAAGIPSGEVAAAADARAVDGAGAAPGESEVDCRLAKLVSERDRYLGKYREARQACREARQLARHWQSAYWGLLATHEGPEAVQEAQRQQAAGGRVAVLGRWPGTGADPVGAVATGVGVVRRVESEAAEAGLGDRGPGGCGGSNELTAQQRLRMGAAGRAAEARDRQRGAVVDPGAPRQAPWQTAAVEPAPQASSGYGAGDDGDAAGNGGEDGDDVDLTQEPADGDGGEGGHVASHSGDGGEGRHVASHSGDGGPRAQMQPEEEDGARFFPSGCRGDHHVGQHAVRPAVPVLPPRLHRQRSLSPQLEQPGLEVHAPLRLPVQDGYQHVRHGAAPNQQWQHPTAGADAGGGGAPAWAHDHCGDNGHEQGGGAPVSSDGRKHEAGPQSKVGYGAPQRSGGYGGRCEGGDGSRESRKGRAPEHQARTRQGRRLQAPTRQEVVVLDDEEDGGVGMDARGMQADLAATDREASAEPGPRAPAGSTDRRNGAADGNGRGSEDGGAGGGGGWLNKRSRSCEPWESDGGAAGGAEGAAGRAGRGSNGGGGSRPVGQQLGGGPSADAGEKPGHGLQAEQQLPGRRLVQQVLPFGKRQRPPLPGGCIDGSEKPRRQRQQSSQSWNLDPAGPPRPAAGTQGAAVAKTMKPAASTGRQAGAWSDSDPEAGGGITAYSGGIGGEAGGLPDGCCGEGAHDFAAPPPAKRKVPGSGSAAAAATMAETASGLKMARPAGSRLNATASGSAAMPAPAAGPAAADGGRAGPALAGANVAGGGAEAGGGGGGGGREEPGYKYSAVVRGRAEREGLQAIECAGCRAFYEAVTTWGDAIAIPCCNHAQPGAGKGAANRRQAAATAAAAAGPIQQQQQQGAGPVQQQREGTTLASALRQAGGRHRFKYAPPATPEGFWDIGFGDTQD